MNNNMFLKFWNYSWYKHEEVKRMFVAVIAPLKFSSANYNKSLHSKRDSPNQKNTMNQPKKYYSNAQKIGLMLGPLLFLIALQFFSFEGLSQNGQAILASTLWIATWWVTEAIPIPVTSLLPVILFPLTGALPMEEAAVSYADDIIFLIMGGFVIALAMEKWELHRRIAINIVYMCGASTERIIFGFIAATGFLSMWISNTASAMLMVPIGIAIIHQLSDNLQKKENIDVSPGNFRFGKALMLAIAYSASMGGIATLVGSPANAIMVAVIEDTYGVRITFAQWFMFAAPVSILFLLFIWLYITKIAFRMDFKHIPGGKELLQKQKQELGRVSYEQGMIGVVFSLTAFAWITSSFFLVEIVPNINDSMIAVLAAGVLFMIPAKNVPGKKLFDWESAKNLPWGIALLYGCGLSIANAFVSTGLSDWLGEGLTGLNYLPLFVFLLVVVGFTIFLTELTSNGATATMLFPIMGSIAVAMNVHPYALIIAALLGATCAFMLPVSTPPNAVVFGSGYIKVSDMAKTGLWLNISFIILITFVVYFLLPLIWGIDVQQLPSNF